MLFSTAILNVNPIVKKLRQNMFNVQFSELSIGAVRILKKIHINQVVFVYLTKNTKFRMTRIFHFIFLHRNRLWIFIICEFFASMEANLQNPCIDFLKFKMAASNMAALSRKFFAHFDIFLIFLFNKIFYDEWLPNCVYRSIVIEQFLKFLTAILDPPS